MHDVGIDTALVGLSHEPKRQRPLGTKNCKRVRTPGTQLWAACQGAARDGGRAEQRGLPE